MSRRIQVLVAVLLTVGVAAVFFIAFIQPKPGGRMRKPEAVTAPPPTARDSLTGMAVDGEEDFFVVSVLYDNLVDIRKQRGLEDALVVYEALAEGPITRLMAVFKSTQAVKMVGPVRSVRPYFIDWAEEYGGVLMHVGGSPEALMRMRKSALANVDQIGADEVYFSRDDALPAPHNVFTSYSSWLIVGERRAVARAEFIPWRFESQQTVATASQITISYAPDNVVTWVYNPEMNTYVRFWNGERQIGASGQQIAASNVLIMVVESRVIDDIGRRTMKTAGQGPALVLRGGRSADGRWFKASAAARTQFIGMDNNEIILAPGTTWVQVVPSLETARYEEFNAE